MRILFMGTSEFAVPSLEVLLRNPGFQVVAVVTQVDRPRDRGQQIKSPPVKELAISEGIPILQPVKVRSEEMQSVLEAIPADLIVVAAYGQILPEWLLRLKPLGAINVHASLLPRHRGAAPVQRAILEGDTATGITIMQMDAGLDTGPILLQESTPIGPGETAGELHDRLARIGAGLLLKALHALERGSLQPVPQDDSMATKAAKIGKEEGPIDWSLPSCRIHNQIRAFHPWPGSSTHFRGQEIKIWRSSVGRLPSAGGAKENPGGLRVEKGNQLLAACGDGEYLEILEVSLPGRKKISGSDLIHGQRVQPGDFFITPTL